MEELKRLIRSFHAAGDGIWKTYRNEKNMQIHILMGLFVSILSYFAQINMIQYFVLLFLITWVISLELINTAIERTLDLISMDAHPKIKHAKDATAGAVLIAVFLSVIIGSYVLLVPLHIQIGNFREYMITISLPAITLAILICIWLGGLAVLVKWSHVMKIGYAYWSSFTTLAFILFLLFDENWVCLFLLLIPFTVNIFIHRGTLFYYYFYQMILSGLGVFILYRLLI